MGPTASTVIVALAAFDKVSNTFSPTRARYALPFTTTVYTLSAARAALAKARSDTCLALDPASWVGDKPSSSSAPVSVPEVVELTLTVTV